MGKETYSVAAAIKVGGASVSTLWGSIDQDDGAMDADGMTMADSDGFGVKLAYDFGDSGIGLLFRQTDMDNGPEPSTWGIGVQHNMLGAVEVFAGYYVFDPDTQRTKPRRSRSVHESSSEPEPHRSLQSGAGSAG